MPKATPTLTTLPDWWYQYFDTYWQRDDGAVYVSQKAGGFHASRMHKYRARFADEEIGFYANLSEAIEAADRTVLLDLERAAEHRAKRP